MYADYTFYKDTYAGRMSSADYSVYGAKATREINLRTDDRAKAAPAAMSERLQFACCEMADLMKLQETTFKKQQGGSVKAESIDGYSVTYDDTANLNNSQTAERTKVLSAWLTYPFNLLYPGVC